MDHPYYIVAPDYRDNSAGVRVLHQLCDTLNASGHEAYIAGAEKFDPALRTPSLDDVIAARHRRQGRIPIAVYSDVVAGNPLNAPICVRYMLNKEGVIGENPLDAGQEDLFFYYSRAFTPDAKGKFDYLRLHTHDLELFKPDPQRLKKGPLLYLNRIPASDIDFSVLPKDIELLSNQNPMSLPALAQKLQSATALYSYEGSGTCTLAMLCGCPVVAMTLPGYEQLGFSQQMLSLYGGCGYALTDAEDDLNAARESLPRIRIGLLNVARQFQNELRVFIDKTQSRADAIARNKPPSLLQDNVYQEWIAARLFPAEDARCRVENLVRSAAAPCFHIAVVHDGNTAQELARTLRSLAGQYYPNVLVTVASRLPAPEGLQDGRLEWLQGEQVWDSAEAALSKAPHDAWVGLLVAGDALALHALLAVAEYLHSQSDLLGLYTDEDILEAFGTRHSPRFKPDFDPRLLRDSGYIGGLLLAKNEVWQAVGGWRHFPGHEDESDLASRLAERIPAASFGHLADVLYHRCSRHPAIKSVAAATWRSSRARPQFASRTGEARREPGFPVVSILIPTRDQLPILQRCIESLFERTQETSFELIVVDHLSGETDAVAFLAGLPAVAPDRIRVVRAHGPFNFSALINLAASQARGEFLLLLNNDTAALHPEWLPAMLAEMDDPEVGIVGPRMVFPDGRIQHAGAVLGLSGAADYPWVGVSMDEPGYLGLLAHVRSVSAVSGSALLIRRTLFDSLGGMDESYAIAYGDIDLCLRAAQAGFRSVWTPHATLLHEAGQTLKSVFGTAEAADAAQRSFQEARRTLVKRWLPQLARDPAYNINLSLNSRRFELEADPVLQPFSPADEGRRRVLALPADDSGSGVYRVCQPAGGAVRDGLAAVRVAAGYPLPVHFERLGIQTLFSQRQVDDNHLQGLAELRDLLPGLRVVMDFDDLLTAVSPDNFHCRTVWKDMSRRFEVLGRLSDCLTVSTAPLAEEMRTYHHDVRHVPNGIDPRLWTPRSSPHRRAGEKLRVGWAGGVSHAGDLKVIEKVVAELADEVDWIFFGMALDSLRPHLAEFHPGVPFGEYPRKLAELDLDLAIAPLDLNRFNECKSNLRLLEYGALGIPAIATDILPYRCDLPVTLVDNRPQSWVRAIRECIGETDALRRNGTILRDAVLSDWTLEKTLPAWTSAWTG